jgi:ATP-dependent RNA helicase DeaD
VSPLTLPTVKTINDVRIAKFKDQITETLAAGGIDVFRTLIEEYERELNVPAVEIAAALAKLARGDVPLLLEKPDRTAKAAPVWEERPARAPRADAPMRPDRGEAPMRADRGDAPAFKRERVASAEGHGRSASVRHSPRSGRATCQRHRQ